MVDGAPSDEEHANIATTHQKVIVELLKGCAGWPGARIATRWGQASRGVPAPDPRLRVVAGELAQDHLYLVSNGSVASDYFASPTAHRATDRNNLSGHGLLPSQEARHEADDLGGAPADHVV